MILFDGKTYESSEQNRLLDELEKRIPAILNREPLQPERIIDAVDKLRTDVMAGKFDHLLSSLPKEMVDTYLDQAVALLSKEHLWMKVKTFLKSRNLGDAMILRNTRKCGILTSIRICSLIVFSAFN